MCADDNNDTVESCAAGEALSSSSSLGDGEGVCGEGAGKTASLQKKQMPSSEKTQEKDVQFGAVFKNAAIGIALISSEGNILRINQAYCDVVGYRQDYVTDCLTIADITFLDDRLECLDKIREITTDEIQQVSFETRYVRSDGEIIWVSSSLSAVRDITGTLNYLISTIQDITEVKRSLQQLRESEDRFRIMADSSPVLIWVAGVDKLCYWFNKVWLDFTGRSMEEESGNGWADNVHPEDFQRCLEIYVGCFDRREAFVMEYRLMRHDGVYRWIRDNGVPRFDDAGEFLGYIGSCIDITDHKEAEQALAKESYKNETLLRTASDGIHILNADGFIMQVSDSFCQMLGCSREETLGMHVSEWDANWNLDQLHEELKHLFSGGSFLFETKHRRKNGDIFDVEINATSVVMDGESFLYCSARDITMRKRLEAELQLASQIYRNSSEAMLVTDNENHIIAVNRAFTLLTGYAADEVVGRNPNILQSGRHDAAFYRSMWASLKAKDYWHGEIWNRRKNGEIYPELLTINMIRNDHGEPFRHVALFSDITKKKESEELIWRQANIDTLTNLPNRRMFHDRLDLEIKKAHRSSLPLALLLIDLDRFKEVNDTLGHHVGDELLVETARRISTCVRESDTVARLGGDEFTVVLPLCAGIEHVEKIAQVIIEKVAEPYHLGEEMIYISASIGITFYPMDSVDIEKMLQNADQAMYAAKGLGRNRFSYFTPSMQIAAQNRLRLINDLRVALVEKQLSVYFQPIVDAQTGHIHKAEALLRWNHPTRGLIYPSEFIPVAEETGLIIEIGDWVLREAADCAKKWSGDSGEDFQISVNKSPVQFLRPDCSFDWLFEYITNLGIAKNSLVIEITEGLLLNAEEGVRNQLVAYHDFGTPLAIDDFGTGYSALSYLKKFNVDYLKIDQSFVRNIETDANDKALSEAIIVMAHKLGLKVIAEGVETEGQRRFLVDVGCDYLQGYLFSRPIPADEFGKLLKSKAALR